LQGTPIAEDVLVDFGRAMLTFEEIFNVSPTGTRNGLQSLVDVHNSGFNGFRGGRGATRISMVTKRRRTNPSTLACNDEKMEKRSTPFR